MTHVEDVHESLKKEDLLPLLHFKIPLNVIEGKFEESEGPNGRMAPRIFKYLYDNLSLKVWYHGGLDNNLEYCFSVVLAGFGKDYEVKGDWLGRDITIRPKDKREVDDRG